jgi:hypothetical protein
MPIPFQKQKLEAGRLKGGPIPQTTEFTALVPMMALV